MKKKISLLLAFLLLLTGCGSAAITEENTDQEPAESQSAEYQISLSETDGVPTASGSIFAMDTYMTVICYGDRCEEAAAASLAEIARLDDLLSVGNPESEIAKINKEGQGTVSDDTAAMLEEALQVWETTGGAFDITVYPLMEAWGFTTQEFRVPEETELEELLAHVGSDRITYDPAALTVELEEGQGIDLGGIAKGFTSDRLMQIFAEYELESGLVSLGGNVQCYGVKVDGNRWKCGIQDPENPDSSTELLGVVQIADQAVITSGAYERYFTDPETGITYHHIIDPKTGYPAESGLISASIISESGVLADALSTSCYIMGLEQSIAYWQEYGENFEMVLMTEDDEVYITEGLEDSFTSDYPVTVIRK